MGPYVMDMGDILGWIEVVDCLGYGSRSSPVPTTSIRDEEEDRLGCTSPHVK